MHKALADVNRLRIVRRLASGEATVADLVAQVGLSQPLVSWHIGRLRAAGLIRTRRAGRETICRVIPEAFASFARRQAEVLGLVGPTEGGAAAPTGAGAGTGTRTGTGTASVTVADEQAAS